MALIKKEIGELLVDNGLITPDELKLVQQERLKTGEPISLILSRLGLANEKHLKSALEIQFGVNYVSLTKVSPASECLQLLPEKVMRQHQVVPIEQDDNKLTLAMVNPNNLLALDDIKYRLRGVQIQPTVCTEDDFQHFMETIYTDRQDELTDEFEEKQVETFIESEVDLSEIAVSQQIDEDINDLDLAKQAQDAPIVQLANQILAKSIKRQCSDIHIEPQDKQIIVRYRVDGVLFKDRTLPKAVLAALVSRYKIMADLDIAERRLPQDGRIRVRFSGRDIDFRVSTIPTKHGEKVVMRQLDKSTTKLGLENLISDPEALDLIRDMISKPYGIVFVTGPTGSGKTTSLYSALAERNTAEVNICTAEDPIEYEMNGITQVQVLREKGLDFARILRHFLRQDPDIILVGETRDRETAKIAVEAALTGHLVFTTLHTNDAPGAVTRLAEMDVDPYLIASATIGVIAQRLLRSICEDCKEEYIPEPSALRYLGLIENVEDKLADSVIQYYRLRTNKDGMPIFMRGKGCEVCNNTGYKNRIGVFEIMRINDDIRELIGKGAPTARIRLVAKQSGMIPLKDYSIRLVGQGMTTAEEVVRVTLTDTTGDDKLCSKCRNPISDDFVKCPFCQHDLKISCKRCGTLQNETWTSCPKCGHNHSQDAKEQVCGCCGAEIVGDWTECPYCLTAKLGDCGEQSPKTNGVVDTATEDKSPEANESKSKKRKRRK
ncbi:MAG: Flp pilus assembly complex ATPase component TadA [Candidatus Obscuribacterales bacterium]|nr:Flp pilus assembly complex ATPase component TadA [Cyanobacteria bacterium HKST-UBA01]MCB9468422.1 Flp pilus assembly complex ATPase component TadA [Candidatus Obscuribacterales bacterium]